MNGGCVEFPTPHLDAFFNRIEGVKVLRALVEDAREQGDTEIADGVEKLLGAVLELVEADLEYDAANANYLEWRTVVSMRAGAVERLEAARVRRAAALIRIGGAP